MTGNTSYREKGRALFLAALMIMSVFAMSAAFAGTTAAGHDEDVKSVSDGQFAYQGEVINVSGITSTTADDTVDLYEGSSTSDDATWEREVDVVGGAVTLDTSDLGAGDWHIEEADGTTHDFEIRVQDLDDTEFDVDRVHEDGTVDLTVGSNRGGFLAEVSADGISQDDLITLFNGAHNATETDQHTDQDYVVVDARDTFTLDFNLVDVDPGDYTFTIEAADTTASAERTLTVTDADAPQLSFPQSTVSGVHGDHVTVTVDLANTDTGHLNITWDSGNSVYTILNGDITADEEDSQVEIEINTHTLATGSSQGDVINDVEGGSFSMGDHHDLVSDDLWDFTNRLRMELSSSGNTHDVGALRVTDGSVDSINTYISSEADLEHFDEMGASADGTVSDGDYLVVEVEASGIFGYVDDWSSNGVFLNVTHTNPDFQATPLDLDTGDFEAIEDEGRVVWFLDTDQSGDDADDGDEFEVAFTVNADSDEFGGSVSPYYDDTQSLDTEFAVEERTLELDQDHYNVEASTGQMITGTSNAAPGATVNVEAEAGDDAEAPFFKSGDAEVQADGTWAVELDFVGEVEGTEFDIVAEEIDSGLTDDATGTVGEAPDAADVSVSNFDAPSSVDAGDEITVSADITNNEGTQVTVQVHYRFDGSVHETQEVTIDSGATESVEFDFDTSGLGGDYSHGIYAGSDSATGTLTIEGDEPADTPTDEEPGDDTPTDSDDDDSDDDGSDDDSGNVPGFGVGVALVALIAAALLALRRQD